MQGRIAFRAYLDGRFDDAYGLYLASHEQLKAAGNMGAASVALQRAAQQSLFSGEIDHAKEASGRARDFAEELLLLLEVGLSPREQHPVGLV